MGARTKINAAHLNGSLIIAAIIGTVSGSWPIFLFVLAVLVAIAVHSGDIRPTRRKPGQRD